MVPLGLPATAEPGKPDGTSAPAAIASIDRAVADVIGGLAAAVVTNPVAKSVLYKAGFSDPGHTEYLAKLSFEQTGNPAWPVMMLWSPEVAVVPVTIHVPFKEVPERLTRDLIFETGRVVARDLIDRFGIAHPRLAVAGLNPHAGEDGTLGKEDSLIVRPAIERLIADGIDARGPLAADTMFHEAARKTYDAALCMYHDQALIPIKTLAFDHGVNVTLGLPFVRTSPDHGTAFDIAGTGKADPSSLIAALKLAARLAAADQRKQRTPAAAHDASSDLPPLRDVIRRHGLSAKKSLGQNFLLDLNLTGRIARAAGPLGRRDRGRDRPRPRRTDARAARRRRAPSDRGRARSSVPLPRSRRSRRTIRDGSRSSRVTRSNSMRHLFWTAGPRASSPTCPTTSPPRCWCPG